MGAVIYFIGVVVVLVILMRYLKSSGELKGRDTIDVFFMSLIVLTISFLSWFVTFAIFLTWLLKKK